MKKRNKNGFRELTSLRLGIIRYNLDNLVFTEDDKNQIRKKFYLAAYDQIKKMSSDEFINYLKNSFNIDQRISFEILKTAIENKDSEIIIPAYAIMQLTMFQLLHSQAYSNKTSILNIIIYGKNNIDMFKMNMHKKFEDRIIFNTLPQERINKCLEHLNYTLDYELYSLGDKLPDGTYAKEKTKNI